MASSSRTGRRRGRGRRRRRASSRAAGWYSPQPSGPGPERGRAVIGHVGQRRAAVAHPVASVGPPLWGTFRAPRRSRRPSNAPGRTERRSRPRAAAGGSGSAAATSPGRAPPRRCAAVLLGQEQRDPGVVAVARREEGQTLDVVPVQVGEQDRSRRRARRRERGDAPDARCRRRAAARGPAGRRRARWPRTRCGRRSGRIRRPARASSPGRRRDEPAPSARAASSRRCPSASSSRCAVSSCAAGTTATRHGGDGDQRRGPGAALEVRPLAEQRPRPVLGQPLPVVLHPEHAVEDQEDVVARVALAHQRRARRGTVRSAAWRPPCMSCADSDALERRLHRGDERVGVLVAPGGVPAERLAVPVAEVGQPRLVRQPAVSS